MDEAAIERYAREGIHGARLAVNLERARPFGVLPWEERTEEQREQDRRGASAVAAAAVHDAGLDLVAKEMRILKLEAALRRHTHSFTNKGGSFCGGCLEPAPCPDAELIGEGS